MPAEASWVAPLPTAPAAPLTTRGDAGAGASRPMTRWAVPAQLTRAAARRRSRPSGTFVRRSRRVTATAATAPESAKPATGSPMPSPTSRTVPAVSLPMTTGSGRGSVSAR